MMFLILQRSPNMSPVPSKKRKPTTSLPVDDSLEDNTSDVRFSTSKGLV
jgi:hypothetical protein